MTTEYRANWSPERLPENFEARMFSRLGPGVHERLKRCSVAVLGCGGLGSNLSVLLARSGIGRLVLVDFDVVEPSNLNRQMFFVDQLGVPKTLALADNLRRINPYVQIVTHGLRLTNAHVTELLSNCDVVAECFDAAAAKAELSTAMRRQLPGIPLVGVSGIAGLGPGSQIRSRRVFRNHFLIGDQVTEACPEQGLLASRVTLAAAHQANVVVRLLLGKIGANEGE